MLKKIGLFFGSFNPIHVGHLIIANAILEHTDVEDIWFVLSPHNPFKDSEKLLNATDRLKILEKALEDNPHFFSCNIELNLPKPSYTIQTLKSLAEKYPNYEFVIIMGSDNLQKIDKWKNYEQILENYQITVYNRPDFDAGEYLLHKNVTLIQAPLLEISSTYIRNTLAQGKSIKYLVSEPVLQYITENNFYKAR